MATEANPQEVYLKNNELKKDNTKRNKRKRSKKGKKVEPNLFSERPCEDGKNDFGVTTLSNRESRIVIERMPACTKLCTKFVVRMILKVLLVVLVTTGVITAYVLTERRHESTLQSLLSAITSEEESGQSAGILPFVSESLKNKLHFDIGMRQDYKLQDCKEAVWKQSFPDVDYSLLGYNILKGFPLAVGHDPGFTFPIFRHDYSNGGMTADCRYSVPRGLVIIPDVSCVTSFSSTTVQTKYEFSKSLAVSASVSGGGWGVSFSASAGYKESSSQVSTGESVFVLSSAHCNYYFSKLISEEAPEFDSVFVKWVNKLNATDWDPELYFEFFETYGTHFPTEVTFGARFTYEHKMSSSKYESETKKGVNVAVQASYSGLFSVGGGFSMDSDQRESASSFSKSVETRTITVGAPPPANGDAMTWASEVKSSPVPTAYKLSTIETLFSERYMGKMNVDYERIRNNIDTKKHEYCLYLQNEGKVETCESLVAGIELQKTRLHNHYKEVQVTLSSDCIEKCLEDVHCVATTICITCSTDAYSHSTCHMYKESESHWADKADAENDVWQSNIFPEKMKSQIEFSDTAINGVPRGFENAEDKSASVEKCHELCIKDAHCVAYTHCDCPDKIIKCNMYSKERVAGLIEESGTKTFFISTRQITATTPAPTENTPAPSENTTESNSVNN